VAEIGQLYAILIAIVTPVAAAIAIYRMRRLSYIALSLQLILFVELGAIAYALDPEGESRPTPLLAVALVVGVIDIVYMVWTLYRRRLLLAAPITVAQLDRANDRGLVSRLLTIAVVILLLLNFKPWVGVACLVFNALWMCAWIPRRLRRYRLDVSSEIAAPPGVIFPYLVDPAKWSLYRRSDDARLVSVKPDGPLAKGSEIVTDVRVSAGKRLKPYTLRSTSIVTEVVPDASYSTVWQDRPSERATIRLENEPPKTRLTFQLEGVQPFRPASMGVMLDVGAIVAARRKELADGYERLKQILETAPPSH
jgi:hypothetical protein